MKIKFITSILFASLLLFGCKKSIEEDEPLEEGFPLLTISGYLYAPNIPTFVFLSDREGKVLSCAELTGVASKVLTSKDSMTDKYIDFSVVRSILNGHNNLVIETYPNVQMAEWKFKHPDTNTSVGVTGKVTFLADDLVDSIEYALIWGGLSILTGCSELKDNGSYTTVFDQNKKYVFIRFKMVDEDQFRYVQFSNLTDGDTIALDIANYPLGVLDSIQSDVAEVIKVKKLTGLREPGSFKNSTNIYSYNIIFNDYYLPDGKVWYPEGIFDSFLIELEMKQDSFEFYLQNIGSPIDEYNPTLPELALEGTGRTQFRVKSNASDVDFVSATWVMENPTGSIEWTVFHSVDETNFFRIPDLPTCLPAGLSWVSSEDFVLKSLQSHHFQNFENYEDYINAKHGDGQGGEGNAIIITGGNYETKTIIKKQ